MQNLCSLLKPNRGKDVRHPGLLGDLETHLHRFEVEGEPPSAERCGVMHLVHAWAATGHDNGVSFFSLHIFCCILNWLQPLSCSKDMVHSASSQGAVQHYFANTRDIAIILAEMFKVLWPEYYALYEPAFKAGYWVKEDPGPWIGRAVIYKLTVGMHLDKRDAGPTVTFPVGQYIGGHMDLPQLLARFL